MSAPLERFASRYFFPGLVSGLMATSLYLFYYHFCESLHLNEATFSKGVLVTVSASSLWVISMLCYMQILRISPGSPRKATLASTTNEDKATPSQLISICQENGKPRYCQTCKSFKPDRSHHCRICNVCVLKMDHHCSWINGCVGYHNHKIFFLFLFYTLLYLAMLFYHCVCLVLETIKIYPSFLASIKFVWSMYKAYFVTVWTVLWNLWQNAWNRASLPLLTGAPTLNITIKYQIIIMTYLTFIFSVFLLGLTVIQAGFILRNRTTLEQIASYEQYIRLDGISTTTTADGEGQVICLFPPEKCLYDLGPWRNWKMVMGDIWYLWFVPTKVYRTNKDDGHVFPYGSKVYQRLVAMHDSSSRPSLD